MRWTRDGFEADDDVARIDVDVVHGCTDLADPGRMMIIRRDPAELYGRA